MSNRSVSIVICVYTLNRWQDICEAIASVRAQDLPALEIIVVVDHSPELRDRLTRTFSDIVIVENRFTRGLSGARNTGIAKATGEIVAFLDDDAIADRAWLKTMLRHFDDPNTIGVGSRSSPLWVGKRPFWFPDEFLWVVGCSYRGLPEKASGVRNCLGGTMCFRRDLFEKISGFNPLLGRNEKGLLLSAEETELCLRATNSLNGAILIYEPAAFVSHKITSARLNWSYFVRRCYAEGVSKAYLAGLCPRHNALATERTYALNVLPQGVLRGVVDTIFRRQLGGLGRAAAIVVGLISAVVGYMKGSADTLAKRWVMRADERHDEVAVGFEEKEAHSVRRRQGHRL